MRPQAPPPWRRGDWWSVAFLLALTVIPYWQVAGFDFVSLDDRQYVTQSPLVRQGLAPLALWDALTGFHADNWHPLVWWSLMLDFQLFGANPAAFHVENLLWHVINVVLLFVALRDLTGDTIRSVAVAALFGIHPLHVESVAWISERKDVLSGGCWMLGLLFYSRWSRSAHSRGLWLIVASCLLLGLMSKQIVVTLPFVFLLLDAWPLNRFVDPQLQRPTAAVIGRRLREKLPWFGLSLLGSCVAILAQRTARLADEDWPLSLRVSNAVTSVFRYLWKAISPVGLSVQYAYDPPTSPVVVSAAVVGLAAVTMTLLVLARRRPEFLVGWLWFLGTLVPVMGLIQVGKQSIADRYMYLPLIGLSVGLVWAIPTPRSRVLAWCLAGASGACLLGLTMMTARQVAVWRNSDSLFEHAITVDPTNENAHYVLGFRDFEQGDVAEGLMHLHAAVEWDRKRWQVRQSFPGKRDPARLRELNRRWSEIYMMLGRAEAGRHELSRAIADFRQAVAVSPTYPDARMVLGMALADAGDRDAAIEQFEEILRQRPNHSRAATAREVLRRPADPD